MYFIHIVQGLINYAEEKNIKIVHNELLHYSSVSQTVCLTVASESLLLLV